MTGRRLAGRPQGQPFVLYFYPKDDTSGCTKEAIDFSAAAEKVRETGGFGAGRVQGQPGDPREIQGTSTS